jgi:rod shape-determining protein MreD
MTFRSLIRPVLIGLVVVAMQWLILGRLRFFGAYPDAMLLYVAWVGFYYGRLAGTVGGFLMGFCFDAIYGTWGIHMFVKTVVGFSIGLFSDTEREARIQLVQAIVGGVVVALVHNGLVLIVEALQAGTINRFMVFIWLGSTVYTAVVGAIATLFSER